MVDGIHISNLFKQLQEKTKPDDYNQSPKQTTTSATVAIISPTGRATFNATLFKLKKIV